MRKGVAHYYLRRISCAEFVGLNSVTTSHYCYFLRDFWALVLRQCVLSTKLLGYGEHIFRHLFSLIWRVVSASSRSQPCFSLFVSGLYLSPCYLLLSTFTRAFILSWGWRSLSVYSVVFLHLWVLEDFLHTSDTEPLHFAVFRPYLADARCTSDVVLLFCNVGAARTTANCVVCRGRAYLLSWVGCSGLCIMLMD